VSLATFALILYTKSTHVIYFVIGFCWTAALAKSLKRLIAQSRPNKQPGYGMPSAHSQIIMFVSTYYQCAAYDKTPLLVGGVSLFALSVVWSRVQMKHHTISQVLVGALIGILSAILWYSAWSSLLFPRYFLKTMSYLVE
jgi:dolichyldiphosphatase